MDMIVYVGTYSVRGSKGIYAYGMDGATGELSPIGVTDAGEHPSYLAVDPKQRFLYAVNEVASLEGKPGGAVRSFALDRSSGALRFLNVRSTRASGPCHLSVDASARCVLVASYGGGAVTALPILPDGSLGEASDFVRHPVPSVLRPRQEAPHAHSIIVDPSNAFAFVPDLGLDRIVIYGLDSGAGRLLPHSPPWVELHPGAGPRHFAFHPDGRFAYVINELDNTVCSYRSLAGGGLEYLQRMPSLPAGWSGTSSCADIHVSPDGGFVYGSNRGHDSIVIYAVERGRGTLTLVGHEGTRGSWPRAFAIDPTGRFLLSANERSDSIVCFAVDARTGTLRATGQVLSVPSPVCVKVLPPPASRGGKATGSP